MQPKDFNSFDQDDIEDGFNDELEMQVDNSIASDFEDCLSQQDPTVVLNEYGEVDEGDLDETHPLQSQHLAHNHTPAKNPNTSTPWSKRSRLAPNETDKEFQLFRLYCMYGGGRSLQYISQISGTAITNINKTSKKNSWLQRSAEYDRHLLASRLKEAEGARHEAHMQKLESYRIEQEALGRQLTLNAASIAFLAGSTLEKLLTREATLDTRDLPAMLNAASKLAEVGKNLQSTALGVDQLLGAIEEAESD